MQTISTVMHDGFYIFCTVIGTVLLAIASGFIGSFKCVDEWNQLKGVFESAKFLMFNSYTALASGMFLFAVGSKGTYQDSNNLNLQNKRLIEENNTYNNLRSKHEAVTEDCLSLRSEMQRLHCELVETWLKGLFNELNLTSRCRITVYYENEREFSLLARYSRNPEYKVIHTQKFPLNQGVISQAWQHGEHLENEAPCFQEDQTKYLEYMCTKYSYETERLQKLTMKGCFFFAKAIIEADTTIGVIVMESDQNNVINDDIIKKARGIFDTYQSYMCKFVRDAKVYDQSISSSCIAPDVDEMFLSMDAGGSK